MYAGVIFDQQQTADIAMHESFGKQLNYSAVTNNLAFP
jgi:hypothetical protein